MSEMLHLALRGPVGREFALDVTADVPLAGVTAIAGPSGAGKTSLLRAVAGLDRIAGTIRFGEEVWQEGKAFLPAHRRRTGYVFQGAGLLPHLSVSANLDYAARRAPAGPFDRDDVIARTGIAPLLRRSPARLSGGEAQRAAIARALLSQPRLLLMDEPLAGLDSEARAGMLEYLVALFDVFPVPVVYVSHDATEPRRLTARAIHLREGRLERLEGF